jgi:hypothetical protein
MACVGGLGQFEFRFAAEFIEVSLAPQKGRPAQIPKHGGIGQNARQSREQCRSELLGKRRDRRMRDAPLDGPRAPSKSGKSVPKTHPTTGCSRSRVIGFQV